MKKIKLFILIVALSMAAQYCDSGSSGAAGLGGPEVTPEEIVEETTDLTTAESSDVLAAVQSELEKNASSYSGNEDAEDEAEEQAGEDTSENLGEAVAEEEGDVVEETTTETTQETAAAEEQQTEEQAAEETTSESQEATTETQQTEEQAAEETASESQQTAEATTEEQAEEDAGEITGGMTVELDTTVGRWYKVEEKALDSATSKKYKKNKDQIKEYRKKIKALKADLKEAEKEEAANGKGKGKALGKSKSDQLNAEIDEYLALIKKAREESGYGQTQKGIYTYWANENLRLSVKNVSTAGWYTLRIVAKNYGTLPAWYKQFNVTIENETDDAEVGGISIPASDTVYYRGAEDVYLDTGDTDLNLLWTNDAYKENSYDANIQIKRVTLKWSKKSNKSLKRLVRNAHEYTSADGRFFWDNNSAWTYWQDQTLGFSFPELEAGKYEITVMGKNYGEMPLPSDYEYFTVAVDADGTSAEAQVPAAIKGWRKGSVVLDITGGTDIFLTWLNDSYKENDYDANFQFKKLMLKRVGESDRSALAAYLLGTKSGNRVLMTGILLALVGLIAMISIWNRGRAKKQA
ncbi:MAG TPA: hypothetical protein PK926_02610 [Spirochaetota bacterium]|nr:hypothetical protein [Spirochaetota bacterium]HPI88403.1 hypothetical protein [Spirochaetota bacterium]HPR46739.1 hypothetical protein [Spirochaetota bacterium]